MSDDNSTTYYDPGTSTGVPDNTDAIAASLQSATGETPDPALIAVADAHGLPAALRINDATPTDKITDYLPADEVKANGGNPKGSIQDYLDHHSSLISKDKLDDADADQDEANDAASPATLTPPQQAMAAQGSPGPYLAPPSVAAPVATPASTPALLQAAQANGANITGNIQTPSAPSNAPPPVPPMLAAAPVAITVPGYEGQKFTKAQATDADGVPSQAEWLAAAQAQQPSATAAATPAATAAPSYKDVVRKIESSGNDSAVSSTGATGRYQFTNGTWKQYGSGSRLDPANQENAMDALTTDNRASLTKALGRAPTDAELYLAHNQGAAGATKLLANPGATPAQLGLGNAVAVNGGNPNAPASAFVNKMGNLYNGASGGVAGDTQVATNPDDQTGFHNTSGKASQIPGMPANTNATPATPDTTGSPLALLNGGSNGAPGFNLSKFGIGLQGVGAALMARDNPQGASALLASAAALRKAQDDAQGLTFHGTTASGKNYLYTDAKGNIVTKPVPDADQADDKNTFHSIVTNADGSQSAFSTDPQGKVVLQPLGQGVTKLGANGSTETDLTKNPPSPEELAVASQIGNYQTPMPTAYSSRSPQAIRMRNIIATQYPDFQAQQYQTAQKTMNDASTGKLGTANNALETVTGHLDDFSTAADALNNGNIPMLNLVANKIGVQTGATPQVTINNLRQGIADELMKTYRGGGQPSEKETAAFQQLLDPNASPAQMKASVGQFAEMLQSKVDANQRQYTKGMRGNADSEHGKAWSAANPLFSQDQQGTLDRLQDKGQDNEDTPRGQAANAPSSAQAAPTIPKPGAYRWNPQTRQLEPQ